MPLAPGARLAAYEIHSLVGAGGMGEVYRARDTRLNRDVAIKVLPEAFLHDADRLARFKREAQVLASLSHPNIAAIYGVEEGPAEAGHHPNTALVLELVAGPTLADRIADGPMPIDEALPIARQIAEALGAAHDHGIVHRDLKPANIKLTSDGTVKVLDFGLAKTTDISTVGRDFGRADMSMSPTLTSPVNTMGGVLLGTAAYMSPEQAKGKPVDKRSDIWAFGCVLYEMLTGTRAFEGEDVSDTLAAILRGDPDWRALPADAPSGLTVLLRRCLDKDRRRRIADISAALFVLNEPALLTPSGFAVPVAAGARIRERVVWAALVLAAIAATAAGAFYLRPPAANEPERRLSIVLPRDASVGHLAVSPDGRRLALVMRAAGDDRAQIWVRSLDSHELHPLPGTFASRTPFWSPDGRSIGFFADGKLKVIPAAGGPPQELCDGTGLGTGGTWNRNGVILFGNFSGTRSLRRVDAAGGPCTDVMAPEEGGSHAFPMFLPDGDHFLYLSGATSTKPGVYVASLGDPAAGRRVLSDLSSVIVAPPVSAGGPAHLFFLRQNTLMAQRFDLATLELVGDPVPVATGATTSSSAPQVAASVSDNGLLAYVSRPPVSFQLTWIDRAGKAAANIGPAAEQRTVVLSPNEQTIVFTRGETVLSLDLARGIETPVADRLSAALWSPDGARLAGAMMLVGASGGKMVVRELATGKQEELAIPMEKMTGHIPSDWSRDGRVLLYTENHPKTQGDIWVLTDPLNVTNARKSTPFLVTNAVESQAQLSADGRWVAYTSNESGQYAVYVAAFPSGAGKRRVSPAEGREPRWRRDGRELYYLAGSSVGSGGRHSLMAVPVQSTATDLVLGAATVLFDFAGRSIVPQGNWFQYAPALDGKRFLVSVAAGDTDQALHVVTNWQATK